MKRKLEKQELHQIFSRKYLNRDLALNQSIVGAKSRKNKFRIFIRALFAPEQTTAISMDPQTKYFVETHMVESELTYFRIDITPSVEENRSYPKTILKSIEKIYGLYT